MKMLRTFAVAAALIASASFASAGDLDVKLVSTNGGIVGNLAVRDHVKVDFSKKVTFSDQSLGASVDSEVVIKAPTIGLPLQGDAKISLAATNTGPVINVSATRLTEFKDVAQVDVSTGSIGAHVKSVVKFVGE